MKLKKRSNWELDRIVSLGNELYRDVTKVGIIYFELIKQLSVLNVENQFVKNVEIGVS